MYGTNNESFGIVGKKSLHVIERIVHVSITEGERYYLRKLLNHVKGARSHNDLKIINGIRVATFREADLSNEHMLNTEQCCAYEEIMKCALAKQNTAFFIDGPGGTGKTFLYKTILASIRSKGLIRLATTSSGVAAALLPRGQTGHSRFKIPISVNSETTCSISKQSSLAHLCRTSTIIIWDEAPMVNRSVIECLDRLLRDLCETDLPFGGKAFVFGGDFRQVLPIVKKGTKEDIMNATLINSYLWPFIIKFKLVKNVRAQSDKLFLDYLLRIGNGTELVHTCGLIKLPAELVIPYVNEIDSVLVLLDAVFPDFQSYITNTNLMMNRVILSPKNEDVYFINTLLINRFSGEPVTYYSFDEPLDVDDVSFNEDFVNSFIPNGVPPHELLLKPSCPIILLRNINPSEGLCNGIRLVCKHFKRNVIDAEIAVGEYKGKRVFLPRIPFIPSETDDTPSNLREHSFPFVYALQ